jgi:hypothetical protein
MSEIIGQYVIFVIYQWRTNRQPKSVNSKLIGNLSVSRTANPVGNPSVKRQPSGNPSVNGNSAATCDKTANQRQPECVLVPVS